MNVELTCLACGERASQTDGQTLPLCPECRKAAQSNASGVGRERPSDAGQGAVTETGAAAPDSPRA